MAAADNPVLRSDVILYMTTRGRGQFLTPEQVYRDLGIGSRTPPMSVAEFRVFIEEMAKRNLLRRWKTSPMGGTSEVFSVP